MSAKKALAAYNDNIASQPKKPLRLTVFYSKLSRQWYFNIRGRNHQIIAQSEGYKQKASAMKTAQLFASNGNFEIRELVPESPSNEQEERKDDALRMKRIESTVLGMTS